MLQKHTDSKADVLQSLNKGGCPSWASLNQQEQREIQNSQQQLQNKLSVPFLYKGNSQDSKKTKDAPTVMEQVMS